MTVLLRLNKTISHSSQRTPTAAISRRSFASRSKQQLPLENIGFIRAYGRPVATVFVWSAITYMSFQAIWSKLYFDEVRLETEARIDLMKTELEELERTK